MFKRLNTLRCENGQALVELAFVLPLVLLFLFGIIDFGLALNNENSDTNMANLAARTASVYTSATGAYCNGTNEATLALWVDCEAAATGAPTPTNVYVCDTAGASPSSSYTTGDPIKVVVTSNFSWLKLLTGKISNLSSTISGSATMRLEATGLNGATSTFLPASEQCPS